MDRQHGELLRAFASLAVTLVVMAILLFGAAGTLAWPHGQAFMLVFLLLIFVSMAVGQVLRLRDNLLEVPISAMLVLGVGTLGAGSVAWQRIVETLVGAAVGVATNLLFPPKIATASAKTRVLVLLIGSTGQVRMNGLTFWRTHRSIGSMSRHR